MMERHAFIGTVPFTILEAINFVVSNNIEDADLYVVDVTNDSADMAERIRETDVFKKVYIVPDVLLTYPITIKKCLSCVRNGKTLIKRLKNQKYDYCYYNNSGWLINSIFYTGFYKGNKEVRNRFLEHGLYSYTSDYADKPLLLRFAVNFIGFKCMDGSMLEALYMFEPSLIRARHDGELRQMQKFDKNNKRLVSILNHVFRYNPDDNPYRNKKIIIMEQGPLKKEFNKEELWNAVFKQIDLDNTIVKAHPRQKNSTLQGMGASISRNHTTPWEIETLNNNLDDKAQITVISSACITPKFLFDEEPIVIFLYKLIPVPVGELVSGGDKIAQYIEDVCASYRNPEKCCIPRNYSELENFCTRWGLK